MSQFSRRRWAAIAVVVALLAVAGYKFASGSTYHVDFVMPAATGLVNGDGVLMNGNVVGTVSGLSVQNNAAVVGVNIDSRFAPLPAGSRARITWDEILQERQLEIVPGPRSAAAIPNNSRVLGGVEDVELDNLLASLDPTTMRNVNALVPELEATLSGNASNLSTTLRTGGPAINALGDVMAAVGQDGPAIRSLITQLKDMVTVLSTHGSQLSGTIQALHVLTADVASQQAAITQTVAMLPTTLAKAESTLNQVPSTVSAVNPLLQDLQPAASRLPAVAAALNPVLQDLRPTVAQLRPTIAALAPFLREAPLMLDNANAVLPGATSAVDRVQPAVSFLRPYSPELAGWLANWGSLWATELPSGQHYARALITASSSSFDNNPGFVPPGMKQDPTPAPGSIVGQSWTDANGDPIR